MRTDSTENKDEVSLLIDRAKGGSADAFGSLYERYSAPIFRFVYFRVKNSRDAEDLTQIIFLKAWRSLPNFEQRNVPFSSWLYAIARNATIDYWKKKKEVLLDDSQEFFQQIEDERADLAHQSERQDTARTIRRAISSLGDEQREIVTLKFIEELSNREIASLTGKTEDAVRHLQWRAIRTLRNHFKDSHVL